MILYLQRHTKVDCPTGLCYGQTDVDLAETWEQEFAEIHSSLQNIVFDAIYSSPLKRCATLAETFAYNNVKVHYDKRLMELNFGLWEGKYWEDIKKTAEAKPWFDNYVDSPCPNGESYADLSQRAAVFLHDLKKNNICNNVLIVCHGGTIRAFISLLTHIEAQRTFDIKIDYGSITTLNFKNEYIPTPLEINFRHPYFT